MAGTVFSAVVKSGSGLFYDCEELTNITNISIAPKSTGKENENLAVLTKPFLTVLKMQYEGPVIEGQLDEEAEKEALNEPEENDKVAKNGKKPQDKEEEGSDEDDDEDFDAYKVEAKEAVLGCFTQQTLHLTTNIHLFPGEQYRFLLSGSDLEVHLIGSYIHGSDSDDDPTYSDASVSEEDGSDMHDFSLGQIVDSEEESADESRFQDIVGQVEPASSKKDVTQSAASAKNDGKPSKKRALEDLEGGDTSMADVSMPGSTATASGDKLSKSQKKKLAKKLKTQNGTGSNTMASQKSAEEPKKPESAQKSESEKKPESAKKATESKTMTTPSGLKILDSKIGEGAEAKPGQTVSMRYIGKLDNGTVFDKNVKGDPFRFKLGKGEVIKGWDEGVKGMKIGGERKLIVPAGLAYGKRGAPPAIPPNATLTFEVKLLATK